MIDKNVNSANWEILQFEFNLQVGRKVQNNILIKFSFRLSFRLVLVSEIQFQLPPVLGFLSLD